MAGDTESPIGPELIAAWAHHNGTLSHIGNFESEDHAIDAARGWKEQADNKNLSAMIFFSPVRLFTE